MSEPRLTPEQEAERQSNWPAYVARREAELDRLRLELTARDETIRKLREAMKPFAIFGATLKEYDESLKREYSTTLADNESVSIEDTQFGTSPVVSDFYAVAALLPTDPNPTKEG